jgi:ribA/ribD-fused uncharacterized protein
METTTLQQYDLSQVISFYKVDETYGGLSNMSGKYFHLQVNDILVRSSESLYQCLRFTSHPDIQREILENKSPKGSKMVSKKYRKEFTREDFDEIKVELMYWCLKVKLCSHPLLFGGLLDRTGDKEIVEISNSDRFWGCVREKGNGNIVSGENVLGKLLMDLRNYYRENKGKMSLLKVSPLEITDFKLLGEQIREVRNKNLN